MTFTFAPAIREKCSLIIGLIGPSGSGKTFSAMRLAAGLCGDKPFAVIDTESGRALHYADRFRFDCGQLRAPFRPESYMAAIKEAELANYGAIVVDSTSHVWDGAGGVIDWQEEELDRIAGDDWKKREACKILSWATPKKAHKHFVQQLLQLRTHLILCFRAEEKVKIVKSEDGKTKIVALGFQPICEKSLPYELTVSLLFNTETPGTPTPIKLQEQHRPIFPHGALVDESCGARMLAWANAPQASKAPAQTAAPVTPGSSQTKEALLATIRERKESVQGYWGRVNEFCKGPLGMPGGWADAKDSTAALERIVSEVKEVV